MSPSACIAHHATIHCQCAVPAADGIALPIRCCCRDRHDQNSWANSNKIGVRNNNFLGAATNFQFLIHFPRPPLQCRLLPFCCFSLPFRQMPDWIRRSLAPGSDGLHGIRCRSECVRKPCAIRSAVLVPSLRLGDRGDGKMWLLMQHNEQQIVGQQKIEEIKLIGKTTKNNINFLQKNARQARGSRHKLLIKTMHEMRCCLMRTNNQGWCLGRCCCIRTGNSKTISILLRQQRILLSWTWWWLGGGRWKCMLKTKRRKKHTHNYVTGTGMCNLCTLICIEIEQKMLVNNVQIVTLKKVRIL